MTGLAPLFAAALGHHQAGRLAEAEALYRDILGHDAGHAGALHYLGLLAHQRGRDDVAERLMGQALARTPNDAALHANLANVLHARGMPQAADAYRRAIALNPALPEAWKNLAALLHHDGNPVRAEAAYRRALRLRPAYPEACNGLGTVLQEQDRLDEALACYRRAADLAPGLAAAWSNLGSGFHQATRDAEAIAAYRTALTLRDDPEVHHNLSHALLAQGDFAAGWVEYDWRDRTAQQGPAWPRFGQPRWRGEEASGRRLLIVAEQGLGDVLQFCRYAPLAAARRLTVVLQVQAPLVRLLRRLPGVTAVVALGDPLPAFDLWCPAMSLPLVFGTTLATIPAAVPYLSPWPEDVAADDGDGRRRVGLAWAGNPRLAADRRRSLAVDRLMPLLERRDIVFYSLQKDAMAPPGMIDRMSGMRDLADTAALIAGLDLVIAVDSAVAHLAGAMGKPVWLLNRFDSEWRWLRDRDDSPWYPTLRQFRQAAPGDWDGVIARVRAELARMGDPSSSHWQNGAGCSI